MISRQIIEHIMHARLVIADLSFHNPTVFYELALRHMTGKPTIQVIRASLFSSLAKGGRGRFERLGALMRLSAQSPQRAHRRNPGRTRLHFGASSAIVCSAVVR